MNLLKETKEALRNKGYSWPDDILSIQGSDRAISISLFEKLANVSYDNGYGGQEVASDLVILMKDGTWFERAEYDGSEWWRYQSAPKVNPVNDEGITMLVAKRSGMGWCTLEELNEEPEDDE